MSRIWFQSFTDPESDSAYFGRLADFVRRAAPAGFTFEVHGMSPGDHELHPVTELRCSLTCMQAAVRAKREGCDAMVIGHFQEPGLSDARSLVDMPIIGLGQASMLHACSLGHTVGLVAINPMFKPYHQRQIVEARLQERVRRVEAVTAEVRDYMRAFDDAALRERMFSEFMDHALTLVLDGVDVVVPSGGLPMLLFAEDFRKPETTAFLRGATVMNGLPVAIEAACTAVRLRAQHGIDTSRSGLCALASPTVVDQFMAALSRDSFVR